MRAEPQDVPSRLVPLAACCKAVLIAADTVGSARIRGRDSAAGWAKHVLSEGTGLLVNSTRSWMHAWENHSPYPFQEIVAASDERVTLVEGRVWQRKDSCRLHVGAAARSRAETRVLLSHDWHDVSRVSRLPPRPD